MNERLAQFIEYKTGGNQKEFAALLGWSPQYLHKMLKGDSMGIQPVISLLQAFPELNARWLILGEGLMFDNFKGYILGLLELERFIPVMNRDELLQVEKGRTVFDEATKDEWERRLNEKNEELKKRFDSAYKLQKGAVPNKNS